MKGAFEKSVAVAMDTAMCGMMNAMQWRRRGLVCTKEELNAYLNLCADVPREEFYQFTESPKTEPNGGWLAWESPRPSGYLENDTLRFRHYPCAKGDSAPTVLILHALMSASDIGYQRIAKWFNDRGWNAAFPHLPYHYSRKPKGYLNGELAVTADLVHNGETLRQCVVELRQIMAWYRTRGCREFGVVGTSYGGWNAALLSFLEHDLRFLSLIQPIVNVETAIWRNPGAISMRNLLKSRGVTSGESIRHAHLSSPLHGVPLCGGERVILTGGLWDSVSPIAELHTLQKLWPGAKLLTVRQGHFGYAAMRETLKAIEPVL
jgi:Alpha/beta hydrolase domain containing 18